MHKTKVKKSLCPIHRDPTSLKSTNSSNPLKSKSPKSSLAAAADVALTVLLVALPFEDAVVLPPSPARLDEGTVVANAPLDLT